MSCVVCGRGKALHGSELPAASPGSCLSESGCQNGVWMDDDVFAEGYEADTVYPPCPNNPRRCPKTGDWKGAPEWPDNRYDEKPHV